MRMQMGIAIKYLYDGAPRCAGRGGRVARGGSEGGGERRGGSKGAEGREEGGGEERSRWQHV